MTKRILAILLTVAMVISVVPTAVAAEPKPTYVSLGGSNVNGYGLRGYINAVDGMTINETYEAAALDSSIKDNANVLGYTAEAPGGYPVLVADELGYDLEQLAISSMRVEELRILLDNDYYGDSYSEWRFVGPGKWFEIATEGGIDTLREEYQAKIADADLITVDIGANNFGVYISHQLTSNYRYDEDITLIDPDLAKVYGEAKAYVQELVVEYLPEFSDMILGMEQLVDTMIYALVGFCVNFDIVMDKIYELNPDATIVTVSIQNLMEGYQITVPGVDEPLPLGEIFGALVNAANVYIAVGSPYCNSYYCADVRQNGRVECFLEEIIAYNGDPKSLGAETIDCFNVLDGSPGNGYDRNLHVKYMLYKYILTTVLGEVDESHIDLMMNSYGVNSVDKLASKLLSGAKNNFAGAGEAQTLCQQVYAAYMEYMNENAAAVDAMLYAAYDAVASMLQAAATVEVIDLVVLSGAGDAEDAFEEAFAAQIMAAAMGVLEGRYDYVLPENFFATVAEEAGVSVSAVESVAALYVRTDIGNTFFGHPNKAGHATVANAVLMALENGTTGGEILEQEMIVTLREACDFVYQYALRNGYIDIVNQLKDIIVILDDTIGDAFHGEVIVDCGGELKYAYVGADYEADLDTAITGVVVENVVAAAMAEADLITVDFNGDEFINYMVAQITSLAAGTTYDVVTGVLTAIDEDPDLSVLVDNYLSAEFDEMLARIEALGNSYAAPDWNGFDDDAIAVKEEILNSIKNLLVEQLETLGLNGGKFSKDLYEVIGMIETAGIMDEKTEEQVVSITNILSRMGFEATIEVDILDLLVKATDSALYGYFTFVAEFPAELDAVHAVNPDAQIVILGLQNNVAAAMPEFITQIVDLSAYNEYIEYIVYALNLHLFAYAAVNYDTTYVEDIDGIVDALTFVSDDHDYIIYEDLNTEQHKVVCSNSADHFYTEDHVYADEQDNECELCGHVKFIVIPMPDSPSAGPSTPSEPSEPSTPSEPEDTVEWNCSGDKNCPANQLTDIAAAIEGNKDIWWHEAVDYVIDNGLMNGISDTKFAPNATSTRAMLVTILWREEGCPIVKNDMGFEDVAEGQWYTEAIRWAASEGIVDGVSDTKFAPNANITREQLVAIFYRYANTKGIDVDAANPAAIEKFNDVDEISTWAYDALKWACGVKFVDGKENNNIDPAGNATRAEMATLIMRFNEDVA